MRIILTLLVLGALTACNRPTAEAPNATGAPAVATASPADAPVPAVDPNCEFCADPGFVRTCEIASGVSTTLHWNVADPAIAKVNIFVVDDAGKDSPFADQPSKGSIKTGPWLKPGLTFKLKDPEGNVLQTVVIEGKDC
ncbi:MAG: hypothetical protein ABWX88_02800 [Pseudoxanthomonas sp.]